MLRQDVNLYRSYLAPKGATGYLTWKNYWLSVIFFTCCYLCLYFYSLWTLHSLNSRTAMLTATSTQLQQEFIQLKGRFPPLFFTENVTTTLNHLKNDIDTQRRLLASIKGTRYFSVNLTDFSSLIVPNVWLTRFTFEAGGEKIQLSGKSLNKEALDTFIKNLAANSHYSSYNITLENVANMAKPVSKTDLVFAIDMVKKS